MAGWNISEVLGTLRNCQNPEEFDEAAKTLQRQVDSFEAYDKVTYWCYLAAVKLDKRKDAEGALELLNRALRIPLISTEQKVEVLARMAANRIVIGQYTKGLQLHRQALELCESNCPESMHTIMGVYLKQESFESECADVSQTLSFIYEAEGDIDQAVKQEKKALAFYNAEGAKSAHLKKFSEWRLAILKNTLPNTSNADAAEFEEKNNALKELFEFYPLEAVQESISELSNEKDEVLRKLRKTYLKYHRLNKPEMRGKLEKLKQLITELNTAAELPLIMRGEAAKLKEDDHPNIPPLPLNGQTTAPRVSFNDAPSSYRKPIIQSTTSRMVSLANQQSDRDW
jgi:tetratricopeptide (TPR) repeat protein